MLYLIALGLDNEKDITLKGLEAIKKCNKIYLETYTSKLNCSKETLEKLYNKKIIEADRNLIENNFNNIIEKAKKENTALLIPGDIFSATTHISLLNTCKELNCKTEIINNASILTAIGITGLSLYNLGKITTIPFNNKNIKSPIKTIKENLKSNLHSLILLDIGMNIKQASDYLIKNNIKEKAIACARLGSKTAKIKYSTLEALKKINFGKGMRCLIIPSKKLHFIEQESLEKWK